LSILGDVPQRNGLSRMDGRVRNDDVGLGLWSADLRQPQTRWAARQPGAAPGGDLQPIVVLAWWGGPVEPRSIPLAFLSAAGATGGG
jgi:hypothetical protein